MYPIAEVSISMLQGFLFFRLHQLLIAKMTWLQKNRRKIGPQELEELGKALGSTLQGSARILSHDQGCPQELKLTIAHFAQKSL